MASDDRSLPTADAPSPVSRARRVARARSVDRPAPSTPASEPAGTDAVAGDESVSSEAAPVDGDVPDEDVADGDGPDEDVPDGDVSDGDVPDGDLSVGDRSDGHVSNVARTVPRPAARSVAGLRAREKSRSATVEPEPEPEPPAPKAGRNLPAAIGVGLGLGAIIIASLFAYRPSFAYIVGAAVLYGCYELWKAFGSARIKLTLLPLLVGSVAMLVAAWTRGPSGLVLAALITVLGVFVWRLGEGAQGYTRDVAASSLVVLYLPLLAGFAVLLTHPHDGAARVLAFIATVVCSDTGGYASGVLFGRHPLAPVVSKAKTWEGFAGSAITCCAAGVLFFLFTFHQEWWKGLLFGLAITVTATLGDLGESMIKRDLEIKDMGSLLPGHGGVLDRLDSLLPCAVVAYLVLSYFAPV